MPPAKFDWDEGNVAKCQKHGLSQEDVEQVFRDDPYVFPDEKHSSSEDRFIAIGTAASGRHLFVAFTLRIREGVEFIRPISARYMHEKEVKSYEKSSQA
jgi:uncharacterized protein